MKLVLVHTPNGEIVEIGTGIIRGYDTFSRFPPLSTNTFIHTRQWDGMSAEPLGSGELYTPKVFAISRAEEKLVRQLRVWKYSNTLSRAEYLKLLDKVNGERLSLHQSMYMKKAWADPDSFLNAPGYREWFGGLISELFTKLWADPVYKARVVASLSSKKRSQKLKDYENRVAGAKKAWVTKRKNGYVSGKCTNMKHWDNLNERERRRFGQKVRRGHAWRRLASMFNMVFIGE